MKKLIVNADDFGYCEAVNYGILHAVRSGIVTSTTMMANMPGFDHAVELAKQTPDLPIGVHMTMTCYRPLLQTHKTMCNEEGFFDSKNKDTFDLDEVYQEFRAQIERVQQAGIRISHLDSHHHVHTNERLRPVIEHLAKEFDLPMRGGFGYDQPSIRQSVLFGKFYQKNVSTDFLNEFFQTMEDDVVYDMMCHPAYLDQFIYSSSSYAIQRMSELECLTSQQTKDLINTHSIALGTYQTFF